MKTVYVSTDTFDVSMTEKEGFKPFQSNLFDYMSDTDNEAQFYIPMGYRYTDPDSGERWSGEFVRNKAGMPTLANLAEIRNKAMNAVNTADEAKETADEAKENTDLNTTTLDDVMTALVELADLVAAVSEEPTANANTTNTVNEEISTDANAEETAANANTEETTANANTEETTANANTEEVIQNG